MFDLHFFAGRWFATVLGIAVFCTVLAAGVRGQSDGNTSQEPAATTASDQRSNAKDSSATDQANAEQTPGTKSADETAGDSDRGGKGQEGAEQSEPGPVERVMEQLMEERHQGPAVQPHRPAEVNPQPSRVGQPVEQPRVDAAVEGSAPDSERPKLLPEGTFIVNRRGRLIRSGGGRVLFSFDADDADSPETPMVMLRCLKLQDMEQYVEHHGDETVFKVSGEVHVYRGVNYLMPTMMVPEIDRGNLE